MRVRYLFIAVLLSVFAHLPATAQLKQVSFEQLDSLLKKEDRPTLVFIHTDWCKVCQQMKQTSLKDSTIVDLLNRNFYFVSFDAETDRDINYRGQIFKYKPTGNGTGVHELAEQLGTVKGELNYPSLSVINSGNEIIFQHGGLLRTEALKTVLEKLSELE